MEKKEKQKYFEEALSDFVHDVASGRAIRHLVDSGFTTDQIMQRLDFPTPRERVENTVLRYMMENGTLLDSLPVPEELMETILLDNAKGAELCALVSEYLDADGEENSYVSCPFGMIRRDRERRLRQMTACLTTREREYLLGIPWKMQLMYHRMNSRMREISLQMAVHSDAEMNFYFLRSRKIVTVHAPEKDVNRNNALKRT